MRFIANDLTQRQNNNSPASDALPDPLHEEERRPQFETAASALEDCRLVRICFHCASRMLFESQTQRP